MTFSFRKRNFIDTYDLGMALKQINQYQDELLTLLETAKGQEVHEIQSNLNKIAYHLAQAKMYEQEFDRDV